MRIKTMIPGLAFCFLLLIILYVPVTAQQPVDSVDAYLLHEMVQRRIPGMQVAIVQKSKIVFLKSYGIATVEDSIPVTDQTLFPVHSITKAFVGVAVMQLVESGKLQLDAPVQLY